jgi:hypothetical protein
MFVSFYFLIFFVIGLLIDHVRVSSSASGIGSDGIQLEFDSHRLP